MKKILCIVILSALLLAACGDGQPSTQITIDEYEKEYVDAFYEMSSDSKTLGKMEKLQNGKYSLVINEEIMLFADVDKDNNIADVSIAGMSSAVDKYKDLLTRSVKAFITSVDGKINETQQAVILDKLGITFDKNMLDHKEVYDFNDIRFVYNAVLEDGTFVLKAERK